MGPGHCIVTGALTPCCVSSTVPFTSSFALDTSALRVSGVTAKAKAGMFPPVGKNASRISEARWNSRSVFAEKARAT